MIVTYEMLKESLVDYKAKDIKIKRMSDSNEIIKLTRNLYETDKNVPGHLVANAIYSPSYLSFDFALSYYGLIPEAVHNYTSATFKKGKKKKYINPLGAFFYQDVPSHIFPFGISIINEADRTFLIATPEKALCDKLYTLKPVSNKKEMYNLLFNDLRIEINELLNLNLDDLFILCENYKSTNMNFLKKILGDLNENSSRTND